MVCRNYTNLVSQCDLLFLSVVLRHTNCPSTWRQYYNRSPTNPDVNYNPPRTSLTPLFTFDVKSLFTSIPLQLTLQCTETAILQSSDPLPLPTEDIMDLLNLCLTSTYFQYNGKHYKQLHGTAMGSPVSVVVAEIVMQNIEESALSTCWQTIPLWLRFVDDTFTAVRQDEIDAFHHHLNGQNTDIQFTREVEEKLFLKFVQINYGMGFSSIY